MIVSRSRLRTSEEKLEERLEQISVSASSSSHSPNLEEVQNSEGGGSSITSDPNKSHLANVKSELVRDWVIMASDCESLQQEESDLCCRAGEEGKPDQAQDHEEVIQRGIANSQKFLVNGNTALTLEPSAQILEAGSKDSFSHITETEDQHGNKVFTCNICNRSFGKRGNVRYHRSCANRNSGFECKHCSRKFKSSSHLTYHVRSVHTNERPFKCEHCSKSFHQSVKLKRHSLLHTGERPFKCDLCPKRFKTNYHLKEHRNIHTVEQHHVCPNCEKTFADKNNLRRHFKLFHSLKKIFCSKCNITSESKYEYEQHYLNFHKEIGDPSKMCFLCNKSFSYKKDLLRHKTVHHSKNKKSFACLKCNRIFTRKDLLVRHSKIHTRRDSEDVTEPDEIGFKSSPTTPDKIKIVSNSEILDSESGLPKMVGSIDLLPAEIYSKTQTNRTAEIQQQISKIVQDISVDQLENIIDKVDHTDKEMLQKILLNLNVNQRKTSGFDQPNPLTNSSNNGKKSLLNRYRKQSGFDIGGEAGLRSMPAIELSVVQREAATSALTRWLATNKQTISEFAELQCGPADSPADSPPPAAAPPQQYRENTVIKVTPNGLRKMTFFDGADV